DLETLNYSSLTKAMLWQATTAAVSVRKRLSPKLTGIYPFFFASSISSEEKSPSGPIRIVIFCLGSKTDFSDFLSVFSQWAMHFKFSEVFSELINSLKGTSLFKTGK